MKDQRKAAQHSRQRAPEAAHQPALEEGAASARRKSFFFFASCLVGMRLLALFFLGGASFRGPGDLGSTLGLPRQGDKPAGGLGACKRSDLVQWLKCFILESPTRPQAKCRMKT